MYTSHTPGDDNKTEVKSHTPGDDNKTEVKYTPTNISGKHLYYSYLLSPIGGDREIEFKIFNSKEEAVDYFISKLNMYFNVSISDLMNNPFTKECLDKLQFKLDSFARGGTIHCAGVVEYNNGILLNLKDDNLHAYPSRTLRPGIY